MNLSFDSNQLDFQLSFFVISHIPPWRSSCAPKAHELSTIPCIQLVPLKFELTKQGSAGGKIFTVLTSSASYGIGIKGG